MNNVINSSRFIDNKDGTVTDTKTNLMWQQDTIEGGLSFDEAITKAASLVCGGYSDWRLPTIQELQSIVDYSKVNPSIDTTYFPNTLSSIYWSSSSTYVDSTSNAWLVYFDYGLVYLLNKTNSFYVRCVRNVYDIDESCPICKELLVFPRDSYAYCEDCGYPDEDLANEELNTEKMFWDFDEERKRTLDERLAFKKQIMKAYKLGSEDIVLISKGEP